MLAADFLEMTQYSLNQIKQLTLSQRYSILTLLYKKDEKYLLKNWRPLSLLCCDYKIISKTITRRLSKVLDTIISKTQTSSVPGRTMFQNLVFTRDVIEYCEQKGLNAYIISLDQEKAFDKVNREFLYRIMETMNFGNQFIGWIKTLYNDNKFLLLLNGFISTAFKNSRGLKQGDPLSALLYNIYGETLSRAIVTDPNIHGIPLPGGKREVIMQFADDTDLFLDQKTHLIFVFELLKRFQSATGSTINIDKTTGLILGKINEYDSYFKYVHWQNSCGMKILGILFFEDFIETQNTNWTNQIHKLETYITNLKRRNLSLKGKVLILNTVAMARFWHTATILPIPPWLFKRINAAMFNFLWDGENINPIARKIVYQPKDKGGLGLKWPKLQQIALHLKFVKDITNKNNKENWITLSRYWLGWHLAPMNNDWSFLRGNQFPRPNPFQQNNPRPKFYEDVLQQVYTLDTTSIKWETGKLYKEISQREYDYPKAYKDFWIRVNGIEPDDLWKHVHTSHAHGKMQDIHYKFIHRVLPTNAFMAIRFRGRGYNLQKPQCKSCGDIETNEHVFFRCQAARKILDYIKPTISKILENTPVRFFKLIMNTSHKNIPQVKRNLAMTLIQIAFHTIWINRNNHKYDDKIVDFNASKAKIKNTFIDTIHTKYYQYTTQNRQHQFEPQFCHTPDICRMEGETIVVHFE